MFNLFTLEEWQIIGIISTILTLLATAIAVIVSMYYSRKTINQNNKMIEESTRPYIAVFSTFADSLSYIVIKNYGATSAVIDELNCPYKFSKSETGDLEGDIFSKVKGANIAPNQSVRCPLVGYKLKESIFTFCISYHSSTHHYRDTFDINIQAENPFPNMSSSKGKVEHELHNIYLTLLEIMNRTF